MAALPLPPGRSQGEGGWIATLPDLELSPAPQYPCPSRPPLTRIDWGVSTATSAGRF